MHLEWRPDDRPGGESTPAKALEISTKFIHVYPTIFLTTCENAFQVVQGFFRQKPWKIKTFNQKDITGSIYFPSFGCCLRRQSRKVARLVTWKWIILLTEWKLFFLNNLPERNSTSKAPKSQRPEENVGGAWEVNVAFLSVGQFNFKGLYLPELKLATSLQSFTPPKINMSENGSCLKESINFQVC